LPDQDRPDAGLPGNGVARPATVRDLRASLAACQLIVATVVHREVLDTETARQLRLVVEELASDIDYLWEGDTDACAGTTGNVGSPRDLKDAVGRVFVCGNLLNGVATWFTLDPDMAVRLASAVEQLDDTVQLIWATGTASVDLLDG
jgi:hypothetical protein